MTLKTNGLNAPNKDRNCQSESKNKTQIYVVYKKHIKYQDT